MRVDSFSILLADGVLRLGSTIVRPTQLMVGSYGAAEEKTVEKRFFDCQLSAFDMEKTILVASRIYYRQCSIAGCFWK